MEPKVSVIIPVYNVEKYLRECLDSVLGQTLKDIEVICVDDGSTDSSLDILREYEQKDPRVKVLTQPNTNAGAARNHGLRHAKGKYLSFLDSDDFFDSAMLKKAYERCEKDKLEVVVFRSDHFIQDTKKYQPIPWTLRNELLPDKQVFSFQEIRKDRLKCFVGWAWDKLFLREFVQKNQLTFQEQRTTNDMFFTFAALSQAQRIGVMQDVLAHQRKNSTGTLSVTREKSWDCFYHALMKVRDYFQQQGSWAWMEQDFRNYAVHAAMWNLSTIAEPTRQKLYEKLQTQWLYEFGINQGSAKDYYNQKEYHMAMRVLALPYQQFYGTETSNHQEGACEPVKLEGQPKVSIILPSLNVADYIRECLESVVNQTLREIEIICVDAGSTDGTLEVEEEFARKDPRVKVIHSEKKSYGYQMNRGIEAATGKYIGIVETDDWVKADMYEQLYQVAEENRVDFVKADFYRFKMGADGQLELDYNKLSMDNGDYGKVLCPSENPRLFKLIMNTWSGIYNRDFLERNHIDHNETPGASYQDNGFWFKTFALAQRAYFVNKPYYMNRRDNPNSSVYNRSKVYCVNEEYRYILAFLNEHPDLKEKLMPIYCFKKYHSYMFTYQRIAPEFRLGYLVRFSEDFAQDEADGYLEERLYGQASWKNLQTIIHEPLSFYLASLDNSAQDMDEVEMSGSVQLYRMEQKVKALEGEIAEIHSSASYKIGRLITFIPRKIRGGIRCIQENGMGYTIHRFKEKFAHKLGR